MKTSTEKILAKLGMTPAVLSDKLGLRRSTVSRWNYARSKGGTGGIIPYKYHDRIRDLAEEKGVDLELSDFFMV